MKIADSTFEVVMKDGKPFVKHSFNGSNYKSEDFMMIYGLNARPYIKRMSKKMYLPEELLKELKVVI